MESKRPTQFANVLSGKYGKRYTHTHTRLLDTQNATFVVCSDQISDEHLPLKVT